LLAGPGRKVACASKDPELLKSINLTVPVGPDADAWRGMPVTTAEKSKIV